MKINSKNINLSIFFIGTILSIYLLFFHDNKIVSDSLLEVEKEEIQNDESVTYFGCNTEKMKWKGHLKYGTGPFYELNVIESTTDLKELIPKKDFITILKIDSQNLKELPEDLFLFSNLKALDISDNPFTDLEKLMENLTKFPKLELLAMSHCGIVKLPDNISLLKGLLGLSLDQNIEMVEVNENIGKLIRLRYISFRRNKKLKDLPKSIGNLKCLEQINISGAGFTRIREELSLCTNLKDITANASRIKDLPDGIGKLKNLKKLNLAANKIEIIPESIGELDQLVDLSLGTNDISKLPESISKLDKLYSLSLELNRFKEFPFEVLGLKYLRYLNLHNNSFKEIPLDVSDLTNLIRVYVDHEIISDQNIDSLRLRNPSLEVERHDALRLAPGDPKRKN
ncbi:MAG: hypothetical protein WBF67_12785 [Olleya sp.]